MVGGETHLQRGYLIMFHIINNKRIYIIRTIKTSSGDIQVLNCAKYIYTEREILVVNSV